MNKKLSKFLAMTGIISCILYFFVEGTIQFFGIITSSVNQKEFFLLNVYNDYMLIFGLINIAMSLLLFIGLIFKIDFFRKLSTVLLWWSLITAPIIQQWYLIYTTKIKDILDLTSEYLFDWSIFFNMVLFICLRLILIFVLRKHNAGYLFMKE